MAHVEKAIDINVPVRKAYNHFRVMLQMNYDPESVLDKVGDALGFSKRRVEGDLKRFKDFMESRGEETGAWRGEIPQEKQE